MKRGHRLEELVDAGLAPSVRFLQMRLRSGAIPGRKVGRVWVMTDADVEAYLESVKNDAPQRSNVVSPSFGLSAASARRRSA